MKFYNKLLFFNNTSWSKVHLRRSGISSTWKTGNIDNFQEKNRPKKSDAKTQKFILKKKLETLIEIGLMWALLMSQYFL